MGKILVGVMLILLGGTINTGRYIIELTPNFIGSLLLLLALRDFKIKNRKTIWSLWILTGIYVINYILQILMPSGIPFALQPIVISGSLLWGVFIAIKIVESIKSNQEEGEALNFQRLRKWFRILFVITIIIGIAIIGYSLTASSLSILRLILIWIFTLGGFVAIIPRYVLIYCFYKEFKNIKLTN